MVFQDPYQSLHPYKTVGWLLEEPLRANKTAAKRILPSERKDMALQMLLDVGLSGEVLKRYPHQLSGGQRQRVSFAVSLMLSPSLLVADEPFSAVDLPIQIQLIELIEALQKKKGFGVLLISHDLQVLRTMCHSALIVANGFLAESGPARQIFTAPQHSETKKLLEAGISSHSTAIGDCTIEKALPKPSAL